MTSGGSSQEVRGNTVAKREHHHVHTILNSISNLAGDMSKTARRPVGVRLYGCPNKLHKERELLAARQGYQELVRSDSLGFKMWRGQALLGSHLCTCEQPAAYAQRVRIETT
jgi:hypothetical protein